MNDEIKKYLDSLIPPNLPEKKRNELFDELLSHILDRADDYKEIGFSEEESVKKAVEDVGTDEEANLSVFSEFERLYHERTWWALIPAPVIFFMNYSCVRLGTWVVSADWNDDPTMVDSLISFGMIAVCFALIVYARVKQYRKLLIGAAIGNLIVAANPFWCVYPQAAMYAIESNIYLLIDKLTPFVTPKDWSNIIFYYASIAFTVLCAVYCIFAAIRIKKGSVSETKMKKKKAVILASCFTLFAIVSCSLYSNSIVFYENYPDWFNEYNVYISDESKTLYDAVELNSSFEEASLIMTSNGWVEVSEYAKTLEKNDQKHFYAQYNEFDFGNEYTVWFCPDQEIHGNGFVFIKSDENGKVISKGAGNPNPLNRDKKYGFRISLDRKDNTGKLRMDFNNLQKGDSESDVMNRFGKEYGYIYSRFESEIDGQLEKRFAVYAYKETDSFLAPYECTECYIELTFSDSLLSNGRMIVNSRIDYDELWDEQTIK